MPLAIKCDITKEPNETKFYFTVSDNTVTTISIPSALSDEECEGVIEAFIKKFFG